MAIAIADTTTVEEERLVSVPSSSGVAWRFFKNSAKTVHVIRVGDNRFELDLQPKPA